MDCHVDWGDIKERRVKLSDSEPLWWKYLTLHQQNRPNPWQWAYIIWTQIYSETSWINRVL